MFEKDEIIIRTLYEARERERLKIEVLNSSVAEMNKSKPMHTHICLLEICDACGKCNKNGNKFSNIQRVRAINFAMHVFNEDALQYLHTYASPFTLRAHQLDRQRNGQRAVFSLWCPHTM